MRLRELSQLLWSSRRHAPRRPDVRDPVLIRHSGDGDRAALERLAALDSRRLPEGRFLLATVDGELVWLRLRSISMWSR